MYSDGECCSCVMVAANGAGVGVVVHQVICCARRRPGSEDGIRAKMSARV